MGAEINKGVLVWTSADRSPELQSALGKNSIPYVLADDKDKIFEQYCYMINGVSSELRILGTTLVAAVMMVGEFPLETHAFPSDFRMLRAQELRKYNPTLQLLWESNRKASFLHEELADYGVFIFNDISAFLPRVKKFLSK